MSTQLDTFLAEVKQKAGNKEITPTEALGVCKLRGKSLVQTAHETFQQGHGFRGRTFRTSNVLANMDLGIASAIEIMRGTRNAVLGGEFTK